MHLPDVGDAGHVLDEPPIPLLDLPELVLHPATLADLERHQLVRFLQFVGPLVDPSFEVFLMEEQHLLRVVLRRDIDHDPVPGGGPTVATPDQDRAIVDPHDPAVARDQAILEVPRLPRLAVSVVLSEDDLAVVGVKELDPDIGLIEPLRSGIAEHLLHVWAHIEGAAFVVGVHLVHHRRHPFDQRSVSGLRLANLFPGALLRGEVLDHALPRKPVTRLAEYEDA